MSRSKIDKAIYDKERYDKLREQGVSEGRAKRVSTVPLSHDKKSSHAEQGEGPKGDEKRVGRGRLEERTVDEPNVSTTNPRTGI